MNDQDKRYMQKKMLLKAGTLVLEAKEKYDSPLEFIGTLAMAFAIMHNYHENALQCMKDIVEAAYLDLQDLKQLAGFTDEQLRDPSKLN